MKIRKASVDDISTLAKLDMEANLTYWSESEYLSSFHNKSDSIYVLENKQGFIIGCIVISVVLNEAEVLQFWIAMEYKRCGYGTFLLQSVMKKLINRYRVENFFLEVVENNISARDLYLKLGFNIYGKRKNYYKINNIPYDALLMVYSLYIDSNVS